MNTNEFHKEKVIFEIEFKGERNFCAIEMGEDSMDKEVLLSEGLTFVTKSVKSINDPNHKLKNFT